MFKVGDRVRTNSRWNKGEISYEGNVTEVMELHLPSVYPVWHDGVQTSELVVDNSGDIDYFIVLDDKRHFHYSWLELC